jgi:DNA polymerase II
MKAWLMDIYRAGEKLILWLKTPDDDIRVEQDYTATIYLEASPEAEALLKRHRVAYQQVRRKTYRGDVIPVYAIHPPLSLFERTVARIEEESSHRIAMYDADVKPEQMFAYEHDLLPFGIVEYDDCRVVPLPDEIAPVLTRADISVHYGREVKAISINGKRLSGDERGLLEQFSNEFRRIDPDVVALERAFRTMPFLLGRLDRHAISCPLHRWDPIALRYRGGRTFYSYGHAAYRDFAVRLHGRFLIDSLTHVAGECELDGIIELCQLSGTFFQQVASRSFGAVFQQSLVREMVRQHILVPYKEKPIDAPMSMFELVKSDRVGHTFDPVLGFHTDVAEIDFSSMYPWIMYNRNISAETLQSEDGPFEEVPGIPVKISLAKKGLVPSALRKILDRRMYYKKHPSSVNNAKSAGLKWVLVSSYGYCRFREFKLGIASSHMAIGAFAREILLSARRLAEERGFTLVHGIIDSLYLKKEGITDIRVQEFCDELTQITGIPASFEGIFKWVVFLSSVNDEKRPLPARYFGVFADGTIKARGIEVRQRSMPLVVRAFQRSCIEKMAQCSTAQEISSLLPLHRQLLQQTLDKLPQMGADQLSFHVKLSKTDYRHNIPQKQALIQLQKKGIEVQPGQLVSYVLTNRGAVLAEDYAGSPDVAAYRKLLKRSLYILYQQFGIRKDFGQTTLDQFKSPVKYVYIHSHALPDERRGYSERLVRKRLEDDGWTVWRGGFLHANRFAEMYPNVRRKYALLEELMEKHRPGKLEFLQYLCAVHEGMPDLICFRNGAFKFVECKLIYEQLSERQKRCITRLQSHGFEVEVHKVVDHRTKARVAEVDVHTGERRVLEKQAILRGFKK